MDQNILEQEIRVIKEVHDLLARLSRASLQRVMKFVGDKLDIVVAVMGTDAKKPSRQQVERLADEIVDAYAVPPPSA